MYTIYKTPLDVAEMFEKMASDWDKYKYGFEGLLADDDSGHQIIFSFDRFTLNDYGEPGDGEEWEAYCVVFDDEQEVAIKYFNAYSDIESEVEEIYNAFLNMDDEDEEVDEWSDDDAFEYGLLERMTDFLGMVIEPEDIDDDFVDDVIEHTLMYVHRKFGKEIYRPMTLFDDDGNSYQVSYPYDFICERQ